MLVTLLTRGGEPDAYNNAICVCCDVGDVTFCQRRGVLDERRGVLDGGALCTINTAPRSSDDDA